jgi:hypothetical protein
MFFFKLVANALLVFLIEGQILYLISSNPLKILILFFMKYLKILANLQIIFEYNQRLKFQKFIKMFVTFFDLKIQVLSKIFNNF